MFKLFLLLITLVSVLQNEVRNVGYKRSDELVKDKSRQPVLVEVVSINSTSYKRSDLGVGVAIAAVIKKFPLIPLPIKEAITLPTSLLEKLLISRFH